MPVNDSATGGFLAPSTDLPAEDGALDAVLQALIVGVVSLPGHLVRPRWQPKPPSVPEANVDWCAIGVLDEEPEFNIALVHSGDGQGASTSYDNDTVTVLASFYGPTARGNAKRLRTGLMIPQNREKLFFTGLALMEIPGKSMFLPEVVNTQTLRRVDLSMKFRRRTALTWPILNLVEFKGALISDAGPVNQMQTPSSLNPLKE
jgi:hypothetical protein